MSSCEIDFCQHMGPSNTMRRNGTLGEPMWRLGKNGVGESPRERGNVGMVAVIPCRLDGLVVD